MRRWAARALAGVVGAVGLLAVGGSAAAEGPSAEDLIAKTLRGQEMVFARRYDDAMGIFRDLQREFPDSPAGWFGAMSVLEMRMLEREDFHLEQEFVAEAREGTEKANAVLQRYHPGAWDLFLAGSLLGLDGFFKARKGQWLSAYTSGTKSRQIFRRVKEIDPSFVDADFGLGMYLYWRSVFASELAFLKIFIPNKRQEGMAIVERVAREGRFARELARANLGIMNLEERRLPEAEAIFAEFVARYPANVILRTMLGRALLGMNRCDEAVAQFREVLRIDPALPKPHYFIGAALVLGNDPSRFSEAEVELQRFLQQQGGKYWPAYAHYWLGRLAEVRGDAERAQREYETALSLNSKVKDAARRIRGMGGGV